MSPRQERLQMRFYCRVHHALSPGPCFLGSDDGLLIAAIAAVARVSILLCRLLGLILVVIQFAPPQPKPVPYILDSAIDTPLRQPEREHHDAAPKGDAEGEADPEEHAADEHAEDLEREPDDDEGEGDGFEVGLFKQLGQCGQQVSLGNVIQGVEGSEDAGGEVAVAQQIAGPVCGFVACQCGWFWRAGM